MRGLFYSMGVGLLTCAASLSAQRPSDVVHWTATGDHLSSGQAKVTLDATIQDGWHMYAPSQSPGGPTPLTIKVPQGQGYALNGNIQEGPVIQKRDLQFDMQTVFFVKSAHLSVPVKTLSESRPVAVPLDVRFQVCNDTLCLPPVTVHLSARGN